MAKHILSEEAYISALDLIIRRDYYPQLGQDPALLALAPPLALNMTLTNFLDTYTSQDNHALQVSMQTLREKHRNKHYYIDAIEAATRRLANSVPMISHSTHLQLPHHVASGAYQPKNHLMFPASSASKSPDIIHAKVIHSNTRLYQLAAAQEDTTPSDRETVIYGGLKKTDYQLLLTPKVEKTSRFESIDVPQQHIQDVSDREFKVPAPSQRDELARKLAEKTKRRRALAASATPAVTSFTPRRRKLEDFSPAAQKLLRTPSMKPSDTPARVVRKSRQ